MTSSQTPPTTTHFLFLIEPEDAGERLDRFLADQDDPPLSRSQVRRCLDAGEIEVNGEQVKAGYSLRAGDRVRWAHSPKPPPSLRPQPIPLTLLYQDPHLAIVDKPHGLVVHPAPGHPDGTLVNALLHHFDQLAEGSGELRPGIVHRLDKDTSGALVITRTELAHDHLAELFRRHDIERRYHALVFDQGLDDRGTFETLHGRDPNHRVRFTGRVERGRRAVTHWRVLERFDSQAALVECRLETGRTHQIRMHFADDHCPLLGDQLYGGRATRDNRLIDRQALHAHTLGFEHLDGQHVHATAPYPDDFAHALDALRDGKQWRS